MVTSRFWAKGFVLLLYGFMTIISASILYRFQEAIQAFLTLMILNDAFKNCPSQTGSTDTTFIISKTVFTISGEQPPHHPGTLYNTYIQERFTLNSLKT